MGLSPVTLYDVRYDQNNRSPILFLKDMRNERYLPVWIGEAEALSIELAFRGEVPPRPLTHDLLKNIFGSCGIQVIAVVIDRLVGSTYYASLQLKMNDRLIEVDCRPSDGVAVALREGAQILVSEELMYHIRFVEMEPEEIQADALEPEQAPPDIGSSDFKELLSRLKPIDFERS